MSNSKCRFCSDFAELKALDEANLSPEVKPIYLAALVHKLIVRGKGGRATFGNYKLRFCPECGKELTGGGSSNE